MTSSAHAIDPNQDFRYVPPSVSGFKNRGTLFRKVEQRGSNVVIEVYQRSSAKSDSRKPITRKTIPLSAWNNSPIASVKVADASGTLLIKQESGAKYYGILTNDGKPLVCLPPNSVSKLQDETNAVLKAAAAKITPLTTKTNPPQPDIRDIAPPEQPADTNSSEILIEKIIEKASPKAADTVDTEANPTALRQKIYDELLSDFNWVKDLQLDSKHKLANSYKAAEGVRRSYLNLKKKRKTEELSQSETKDLDTYQRIIDDLADWQGNAKNELLEKIFLDPRFQGEEGSKRATRLITSLTLLGEFRAPGHQLPAHFYWTRKLMDNRAKRQHSTSAVRFEPSASFPESRRSEISDWMKNTPAAAALARSQFSVWTTTDIGNLYSILGQIPADKASRDRVIAFTADYEANYYQTADPGIMTYYSPYISQPDWFVPLDLPPVTDTVTGESYKINPALFRGGTFKLKGKKK